MNSLRYVSALRRAVKLLQQEKFTLVHDNARVHISKFTTAILEKEKIKYKTIPGNSPDVMPIENVFVRMKQMLENIEERGCQGVEAAPQRLHEGHVPLSALQDQESYQQQWFTFFNLQYFVG